MTDDPNVTTRGRFNPFRNGQQWRYAAPRPCETCENELPEQFVGGTRRFCDECRKERMAASAKRFHQRRYTPNLQAYCVDCGAHEQVVLPILYGLLDGVAYRCSSCRPAVEHFEVSPEVIDVVAGSLVPAQPDTYAQMAASLLDVAALDAWRVSNEG